MVPTWDGPIPPIPSIPALPGLPSFAGLQGPPRPSTSPIPPIPCMHGASYISGVSCARTTWLGLISRLNIRLEPLVVLPRCGGEWCWCYPLRMRRVEIQISRRGHPIRASPKRLPNQHSTALATLADQTDLRRRSTLYTTRHSTPIGAAKQPPYVVA